MCCNRNGKEPHRAFYCASICSLYIFGDLYEMPIAFKQLKNLCQLHILHSSHSQLFNNFVFFFLSSNFEIARSFSYQDTV